jgi:hypothetical protein
MVKTTLLFFAIFTLGFSSNAQLTNHMCNLSLKYSAGTIDTALYSNYGFQAEVVVNKYIGISYNFDLLERNDNVRQFHAPMGLLGGPIVIAAGFSNSFDGDTTSKGLGLVLLGVAMIAIPDGVNFHLPLSPTVDMAVYANVLGIDFIKNRTTDDRTIKYAASFGTKCTYVIRERFTIAGFVETRKTAGIPWSIGGGMGVGVLLGDN